jgi:hypothetical protein
MTADPNNPEVVASLLTELDRASAHSGYLWQTGELAPCGLMW